MKLITDPDAVWWHLQLFEHWSISVPSDMEFETAEDGAYQHARQGRRSVSCTSVNLTEHDDTPVPAAAILAQIADRGLPKGRKVAAGPRGVMSRAVIREVEPPAVASMALQGIAAADGWLLLVTITADDPAWCRQVWTSIHHHRHAPRPEPGRSAERRAGTAVLADA